MSILRDLITRLTVGRLLLARDDELSDGRQVLLKHRCPALMVPERPEVVPPPPPPLPCLSLMCGGV